MKGFWSKISEWLSNGHKAVLLCVINSKGSSPGRQGFKMAVNDLGELQGSIGGGIMEHKLIELCKEDLLQKDFQPFIKRQIHQSDIPKDKSGMICSGEQTIAFYSLNVSDVKLISELVNWSNKGVLVFDHKGFHFDKAGSLEERFSLELTTDHWQLEEDLGHSNILHIVGGGHVGLALSHLAYELGFTVNIYDDRMDLNTVKENRWAKHVSVSDYTEIGQFIPGNPNDYVVLMSFGYQTDKVILKELITRNFKYLGMMGSKEKVKKVFAVLMEDGITKEQISNVYAPIGIPISSKTPMEIAVSILAEIIRVKNAPNSM